MRGPPLYLWVRSDPSGRPERPLTGTWALFGVYGCYEKPRRLPAQFYPDQFYDIRVRVPPPDNLGVSNGWTVGLWPGARGSSTSA